jgi:lambda family phage portal protein
MSLLNKIFGNQKPVNRGVRSLTTHHTPANNRNVNRYKNYAINKTGANQIGKRSFAGAKYSRLTNDWTFERDNINRDVLLYKDKLDDRVADLSKNNPYTTAIEKRGLANVIGSEGFKLQVKARWSDGKYDKFASTFIEKKFKEFTSKKYFTMSGRLSFKRAQWLAFSQWLYTGEFLWQIVRNVDLNVNPFGISYNILDPRDIDISFSKRLNDDEIVLHGVHIDQWRKIKGIYLKTRKLVDELTYSSDSYNEKRTYIKAEDLIFDFNPKHPKQTRGLTAFAAVMLILKSIDRWDEAALTNATMTAQKMGFLIRKHLEGQSYVGKSAATVKETDPKDQEADYGKYMEIETGAGTIEELPFGYEFMSYDPKYPHEQHEPFNRLNLRKTAGNFGYNYNGVFNDYAGVTFSSLRQGALDERDVFELEQSFFIDSLCVEVYESWLPWSLMSGALAPLSYANLKKYMEHEWQGRRWDWVKPLEEIQAKIKAIKAGVESPIKVAKERGYDIEEIFEDLARIKDLEAEYGVKLSFESFDFEDEQILNDNQDDPKIDEQSGKNLLSLKGI